MALKFFNTLSRSFQEFTPLDPSGKKVDLYCCGPTVYDLAHIGNFRTFIFADLVRRYLTYRGYEVVHVMNVTDVEDKIIARVQASQTTLAEYTGKYEKAFFEDLDALGCHRPHHVPHATAHIAEMIGLIERLMERGIAYKAADGSIYFSIEKYQNSGHRYGQLLNLNFDNLRVGDRVKDDEYAKESLADFALWKARVPEDGAVFWPSPWGEGRPGWHIECSAMSAKILGPSFDLHLGGEDLIFPHHEDEIAQSEGACIQEDGKHFVKYWLHAAHLLVEGKKMSKSLGNYFTLRDLLAKGFQGREIRHLLLSAHYRDSFNFTIEGLQASRTALARLDECITKLRELAAGHTAEPDSALLGEFNRVMDDDLNISAGWAVVFDWVRECNRRMAEGALTPAQAATALASWTAIDTVFSISKSISLEAPAEVQALLDARQAAKKTKDFKKADDYRNQIKALGWQIEDTPKGPKLKKL